MAVVKPFGVLALLIAVCSQTLVDGSFFGLSTEDVHRRAKTEILEDMSLHPPFISDFWSEGLGRWKTHGSTVITDHYVRLTPDASGRRGSVWNELSLENGIGSGYEFTMGFRVHSRSPIGADGIALWLVEEIPKEFGPLFGHPNEFAGIGILFDSYDNDGRRNNPAIHLVYRDAAEGGYVKYNTETDFYGQSRGHCEFDYRNSIKPDVIVARLTYLDDTLQLFLSHSNADSASETKCLSVTGLSLPKRFFIGLTADTGGVTDNHDIYFLHTVPIIADGEEDSVTKIRHFTHDSDRAERGYWKEKTPEELAREEEEKKKKEAEDEAKREAERAESFRKQQEELQRRNREEEMRRQDEANRKREAELAARRAEEQAQREREQQEQQQQPAAADPPVQDYTQPQEGAERQNVVDPPMNDNPVADAPIQNDDYAYGNNNNNNNNNNDNQYNDGYPTPNEGDVPPPPGYDDPPQDPEPIQEQVQPQPQPPQQQYQQPPQGYRPQQQQQRQVPNQGGQAPNTQQRFNQPPVQQGQGQGRPQQQQRAYGTNPHNVQQQQQYQYSQQQQGQGQAQGQGQSQQQRPQPNQGQRPPQGQGQGQGQPNNNRGPANGQQQQQGQRPPQQQRYQPNAPQPPHGNRGHPGGNRQGPGQQQGQGQGQGQQQQQQQQPNTGRRF